MKKTLFFILFLFLCKLSFASINAGTDWEVRTTGSANNGGGYASSFGGTDYSQQDAAELEITDGYTTGANNSLLSTVGGFTDAMKGNIINIKSGTNFITGYYQISSVTGSNQLALDRTCATGAASDGVVYVGGGTNSYDNIFSSVVAGNKIYIKGGTYTTTLDTAVSGGNGTMIKWIGYKDTHDDNPSGDDRPLIDANDTLTNCVLADKIDNFFYNIRCVDAVGDGFLFSANGEGGFGNCKSTSAGGYGFLSSSGQTTICYDCEAETSTSAGIKALCAINCYTHDNGTYGIEDAKPVAIGNVSENNTTANFSYNSDTKILINNISYSSIGYGYYAGTADPGMAFFLNNVAYDNTDTDFYKATSASSIVYFDHNAYTDLSGITAGANDITSDPEFTDVTATPPDFSLAETSPLINAGKPNNSWALAVGLADSNISFNIGIDQSFSGITSDTATSDTGGFCGYAN